MITACIEYQEYNTCTDGRVYIFTMMGDENNIIKKHPEILNREEGSVWGIAEVVKVDGKLGVLQHRRGRDCEEITNWMMDG